MVIFIVVLHFAIESVNGKKNFKGGVVGAYSIDKNGCLSSPLNSKIKMHF